MTDFTARVTEILREGVPNGDVWPLAVNHLATRIAAAAEEHYRSRIETRAELNALPVGSVVLGRTGAAQKSDEPAWWTGCTPIVPAVVLWSPGAGE